MRTFAVTVDLFVHRVRKSSYLSVETGRSLRAACSCWKAGLETGYEMVQKDSLQTVVTALKTVDLASWRACPRSWRQENSSSMNPPYLTVSPSSLLSA